MDATTTYAQATADFAPADLALFERIDTADMHVRGSHTGALFGIDLATRARNEARLPKDKAALFALLDLLTEQRQRDEWTRYRRVMREWRATA